MNSNYLKPLFLLIFLCCVLSGYAQTSEPLVTAQLPGAFKYIVSIKSDSHVNYLVSYDQNSWTPDSISNTGRANVYPMNDHFYIKVITKPAKTVIYSLQPGNYYSINWVDTRQIWDVFMVTK